MTTLRSYYDGAAARYDESRGGVARAVAAATALASLLPASGTVLDVAGGTGIVGARLGRRVISLDASSGMSAVAAARMPGRVVIGDAVALPIASRSVDAVTAIWLLHLLPDAAGVVAEAARVLRPGGRLVVTVDKSESQYAAGDDDVTEVLLPAWRASGRPVVDARARVVELAAAHGLGVVGSTTFVGVGQGRSPARWIAFLRDSSSGWPASQADALCRRLAALPDQQRPRADPVYHLVAFAFTGTIILPSGMSETGMSLK